MKYRKSLFALVVLAAAMTFSFGVFSKQSASAQQGPGAAAPAWTGPKWEYKLSSWDYRDINKDKKTLGDILNEHGAQGWEVVSIMPFSGTTASAGSLYFKRPVAK